MRNFSPLSSDLTVSVDFWTQPGSLGCSTQCLGGHKWMVSFWGSGPWTPPAEWHIPAEGCTSEHPLFRGSEDIIQYLPCLI